MAVLHSTRIPDDQLLCLMTIFSAYDDLLKLMDSSIPEYTFLCMINEKFAAFIADSGSNAGRVVNLNDVT